MIKKITLAFMLCFAFSQISTAQTILSEGFEGAIFPPTGWTSFIGANGIGTASNWIQVIAPNTGTYSAASPYENVTGGIAEDWLVTSQIDLTNVTNAELLFYAAQSYTSNYGSIYEIKVSTASQTTYADFTTVASYTEPQLSSDGFALKTVDLSAYDGMMVYIAFVHYNDDGDNWILDDIEVRSPLNLDAELESVSLNRYSLTSVDNQISIDVKNDGLTAITSLDITWSDGTNSYSENFNVNITAGQTQTINHSTQVNYSTIEEKSITATIDNVNGVADDQVSNNSQTVLFNTMLQSGTKRVLVEEGTGTWCGFCPRGAVGMDYMAANYPDTFVGVAVHNTNSSYPNPDPMTLPEYNSGILQFIDGFPSAVVDRKIVTDPNQTDLVTAHNAQITEIVPVDLSSGATQTGNTLTITANATFYTSFSAANFRLGVIISEDGVTGTTGGYAQVNYYSGEADAPGNYGSLADPVPASQMVYDHVGRALLGGFDGEANSVPTIINSGEVASQSFTYTIPATSNAANMHIVVVLIDSTDGSIVTAQQNTIAQALSVEEVSGISTIKIFPNPATDKLNIALQEGNGDYNITVTDMLGRAVINKTFTGIYGNQNLELPVSQLIAGHYIININDGNVSYSTKFIVSK